MRRQTLEYDYDYKLWSLLNIGSKIFNGTHKELRGLLKSVAQFRPMLRPIIDSGEPGNLFLKAVGEYIDDILTAHEKGKKLCLGTFLCNKLIIFAFDNVVPTWCEPHVGFGNMTFRQGISEYMDYGCEVGFTETSCSAQRGYIAALLAGLGQRPDFAVIGASGPCDTNPNSVQFYTSYADIPLITLDTPATFVDDRVTDYQIRDAKAFIASIEELAGTRINEAKFRELLEERRKQDELLNELMDLMTLKPCPVPAIFHLYAFGTQICMPGRKCTTALYESMLKTVRRNAEEGRAGTYSGKERTRMMMVFIEHYGVNAQYWEWMMQNDVSPMPAITGYNWNPGANYSVGREAEAYHQIDTTNLDTMIASYVGINSRMAMNKQLRGPYDAPTQWLDDILGSAKIMKPDFLVYAGSMGCRNSHGVNKLLQRDCERAGYPTLITFVDCFDGRVLSFESFTNNITEFMKVRRIAA